MSSEHVRDTVEVGESRMMAAMFSVLGGCWSWQAHLPGLGMMWFVSVLLLWIWISQQNRSLRLHRKLGYPKFDHERREKESLSYYIDFVNGWALQPQVERTNVVANILAIVWTASFLAAIVLSVMYIARFK